MAYNSAYTGPQVDAAVGAVQNKESTWDGKQDKLTGQSGQVVGFDADGNAVAQMPPETGDVKADGSVPMTGDLNMGGHRITNVSAPTQPTDAVRQSDLKAVSDEVDGIISGATPITLPPATTTKIGGVIVGDGIEVAADGTISTNPVPAGGTTGQVLTKTSTGEEWSDAPSGLPENGTEGQILEKTSSGAAWVDKPESGLTQEQADARYLQLTGGTLTNTLNFNIGSYGFGTMLKATTQNGDVGIVVNDKQNVTVMANGLYVQTDGGATGNNKVVVQGDLDEIKTTSVTVTLTADGWVDATAVPPPDSGGTTVTQIKQQTVTVSGVSASETAQLITPTPAIASQSAYYEAGIMCTGQAANSLTFTCQTVPTSNLTVYVVIQPLS